MPPAIPDVSSLRLAIAFDHTGAASDLAALMDLQDKTTTECLVDIIYDQPSAYAVSSALKELAGRNSDCLVDCVLLCLASDWSTVRIAAIDVASWHDIAEGVDLLQAIVAVDPNWSVRRNAVRALANLSVPVDCFLIVGSDPHWRVRHEYLNAALANIVECEAQRQFIQQLELAESVEASGIAHLLRRRWDIPPASELPTVPDTALHQWCHWDWDPKVVARTLAELPKDELLQHFQQMPDLLLHSHPAVRRTAMNQIAAAGDTDAIINAIQNLKDSRREGADNLPALTAKIPVGQLKQIVDSILNTETSSAEIVSWAIDQLANRLLAEDFAAQLTSLTKTVLLQRMIIRVAIARLGARSDVIQPDVLQQLICDRHWLVRQQALVAANCRRISLDAGVLAAAGEDPSPLVRAELVNHMLPEALVIPLVKDKRAGVRIAVAGTNLVQANQHLRSTLRDDSNPRVRALVLDELTAEKIVDAPASEASWQVIKAACRLKRVSVWKALSLTEPSNSAKNDPGSPKPIQLKPGLAIKQMTAEIPGVGSICRLGLSGHYGLPVEGFCEAVQHGVNFLFWEPNYRTLTRFSSLLSAQQKTKLRFVAGTFEATAKGLRKDVERALKMLKIESLSLFLVFWVRSWNRLREDVVDELHLLKREGKICTFSLSTHSRELAVDAIQQEWNPVMVRHSAVHRKAETDIFPIAEEHNTQILTFSNTCYGRLMTPTPAAGAAPNPDVNITAADCYRYTLATSAVTACWTAPATIKQGKPERSSFARTITRNPGRIAQARRMALQRREPVSNGRSRAIIAGFLKT